MTPRRDPILLQEQIVARPRVRARETTMTKLLSGRARRQLVRAVMEPLENRRMLSAAFAHAGEVAMAYDATGEVHVAYYDPAARSLNYAECSPAGVWSATTTVDAGPQVGSSLAIAVDSTGDTGIA